MLQLRVFILLLSVFTLVASCSDDGEEDSTTTGPSMPAMPPADTPSFATVIQPLLANRCALPACHGSAGSPTGGMFLGNPPTRASVVAASGNHGSAVTVGNSAASNLYLKTTTSPPFGSRMPFNGPPYLAADDQDDIKNWIDGGAPDN